MWTFIRTAGKAAGVMALASWSLGTVWAAASLQVTVLGKDGQPLPNTVVTLVSSSGLQPTAKRATTWVIEQRHMKFVPALSVVPKGARIKFVNFDAWPHHVRGLPGGQSSRPDGSPAGFSLGLDGKEEGRAAATAEVTLDTAGPLHLGCHIHGSMRGFVYVSEAPWAAQTDAQGTVTFTDLPLGAAQVRLWHPQQITEPPATEVVIQPVTTLKVQLPITPRRQRGALQ